MLICNCLDIGCFPSCGHYSTEIQVPEGQHKIKFILDGIIREINFDTDGGDLILFTNSFPVGREIVFSVILENGNRLVHEENTRFKVNLLPAFSYEYIASTDSGKWQQTFTGVATDTFTPDRAIDDNDFLLVIVNNITLRKDNDLSNVNTYKVENGDLIIDTPLAVDEYLTIYKF